MYVFPVQWQVGLLSFNGDVSMTSMEELTVYSVKILWHQGSRSEVAIETFYDGEQWMQRTPAAHGFSWFFLQCLGRAIDEALLVAQFENDHHSPENFPRS